MSLILDALKRSERRHRRHAPDATGGLPVGRMTERRSPPAAWMVGALLTLVAVALAVLLRPWHEGPARAESTAEARFRPPETLSLERVAEPGTFTLTERAVGNPVPEKSAARSEPASTAATEAPGRPATTPASEPPETDLPTTAPDGLPELSLNVHVHTRQADGRFVVINMTRYHEGERLREGPLLERITEDGAILSWQGARFLLPR